MIANSGTGRKNRCIGWVAALAMPLLLFGCEGTGFRLPPAMVAADQSAPGSSTGNATAKPTVGKETGTPAFAQFADVPIPSGASLDLDQMLILGSEEGWIGRLALRSHHRMADMYDFYEREMPNFRWNRITTVRAAISTMTYRRGGRVVTITLRGRATGGSLIDLTMAPISSNDSSITPKQTN